MRVLFGAALLALCLFIDGVVLLCYGIVTAANEVVKTLVDAVVVLAGDEYDFRS